MKLYSVISILLVSLGLMSFSDGNVEDIQQALKEGNAEKISGYFSSSVQMSLPDSKGLYSKTQAKMVLQKFFVQNKPSDATIAHRGSSGGGANYVIYKLVTDNGSFRVQIFMKNGSEGKIHEIKVKRS